MSTYRQSVHDYSCARSLLNSPDLSDHELQTVQDMVWRISEEICFSWE